MINDNKKDEPKLSDDLSCEKAYVVWDKDDSVEQFVYKNSNKLIPDFIARSKQVIANLYSLITFWRK